MSISAAQVKELRERTGAGMMECKKALVKAEGNIEVAIEDMRKAGQAKAAKKADRIAAEGVIIVKVSDDKKQAIILEVNCETDFVARDDNFLQFSNNVADTAMSQKQGDLAKLLAAKPLSGNESSLEETRQQLVSKLGENVSVRRVAFVEGKGCLGAYLHGSRIGVLVDCGTNDEELVKDLAMHIAASQPLTVLAEDVPADLVAKEREIAMAQAETSGKPADIIEKMVDGKVSKYLKEVSLVGQAFIKDPSITVDKLLKDKSATVHSFLRFEVGEGIEKKVDDFVGEVMAQARGE